ncbi:MAG: T9SS type A sorting domain-containing protein [Calditrichaeota bacterium]|nr:T9SS type A sorting domain-containing protein [Calditrichota bacterium]
MPGEFRLLPPQPNPFLGTALLSYYLPADEQVTLVVYDLLGRQVRTLVAGEKVAGAHRVAWDGKDDQGRLLPSGQYLCVLRSKAGSQAQKVVLLR